MGRYTSLIADLASRLRCLDVTELIYFHTDHFEPWRSVGEAPAVGREVAASVGDFCRTTERIDFARRLTLFYKPHLNYALRFGDDLIRVDPCDLVGFLPRTEDEERFGKEAMWEVAASSSHDIQLHIHHENYTATRAHSEPAVVSWFASSLGRSLDGQRLELAIRLNREIIARETGRRAARWFFVHGHWALNASDDTSCTITNEIEILLRNDCRGDFTFPAGRQHVNPRIRVPYLCSPVDQPKGYDLPESRPEIATGNATAAESKFFIWGSASTSLQCSLDYMSPSSRRQIDNTEKAARELIDNAYIANHRLYVKTHAHSLHPFYFEHTRVPVFPHQYPPTQTLLSVIFDAAVLAGLGVGFLTAPEVYDQLTSADAPLEPKVDLVATYLTTDRPQRAGGRSGQSKEKNDAATSPFVSTPFAAARALERVRETAAVILQKRIDCLGIRDSGAYEHYHGMLQNGFAIPHHVLQAIDIVRRDVPRLTAYHEIGSGIGILPFVLALNGFPAVGIECDRRRHQTARAIWNALASTVDPGRSSCRLVCDRFPARSRGGSGSTIAIFTDFLTTQTPAQMRDIFAGLRTYQYALLDIQRFCQRRDGPEEQQMLLQELAACGLKPIRSFVPAAGSAFVLLHNDSVKVQPVSRFLSRLGSVWPRRLRVLKN